MESIGRYLKTEREVRQISLEELAQTTRIPLRHLTLADIFDGSFKTIRRSPGATLGFRFQHTRNPLVVGGTINSINYDQIAGNTSFGFSIQPAGARAGASYSGFGSSGGSASRFGAP